MGSGHSNRQFAVGRFALGLAILALTVLPAFGQIITVNPTLPPCTGKHCLTQVPGATVQHHGGPSAQRAACPRGTIYDSRKGTCRVVSN